MIEQADTPFKLKIKEEFAALKSGAKPKYEVPSHLPTLATLRFVLTRCCEIRSVPRKVRTFFIKLKLIINNSFLFYHLNVFQ